MVVAAVVGLRQLALAIDRAAEFAAPDDQRFIEQAALLRSFTSAAEGWSVSLHCLRQWLGRLPCWSQPMMKELHEANITLGQSPGEQAIGGKGAGLV